MKQALILFTRVPIEGKTKTRLEKALTPQECARAHCGFLQDIFQACYSPGEWDLLVWHGEEGDVGVLRELLPEQKSFFLQVGETLGEKMNQAITQVFAMGYASCVLIGVDLPYVDRKVIRGAMGVLQHRELVLGPTEDGGYYLIGCNKPCPVAFKDQSYGGSTVFENTVRVVEGAGLSWGMVKTLRDIDEPEDLEWLARELASQKDEVCPHSREFLRQIGWIL